MARRAQRRSRCCEQIPEKFGDVGEDALDAQAHKLGKVVAGPLGVDVPVEDVSRSPYGLAQLVHALDQAGCLSAGALVTIGEAPRRPEPDDVGTRPGELVGRIVVRRRELFAGPGLSQ